MVVPCFFKNISRTCILRDLGDARTNDPHQVPRVRTYTSLCIFTGLPVNDVKYM